MSILNDIVDWIDGKPQFWQATMDKLIRQGNLMQRDLNDLLAICKSECGLTTARVTPVNLVSLRAYVSHTTSAKNLFLSKIHGLQNINALSGSSVLEFAHSGLSAIYGDNGAGKSSYVGILKHVCNTRGSKPVINGNVYNAASSNIDRKAEVEYSVNGTVFQSVALHNLSVSDATLKGVDVFDSHSATHYITGEDEIAFIPHGLSLIEKFAVALSQIEALLTSESQALELSKFDLSVLQIEDGTAAKVFIDGLNGNSNLANIRAGSMWSRSKEKRVADLQKLISELKASDPANTVVLNNGKVARFRTLRNKFELLENSLITVSALTSVKQHIDDYLATSVALKASSSNSFDDLPLNGIGGASWKQLWESARKFYNESTNEHLFPETSKDSNCPLCLQHLDEDAKKRFLDFESFVSHDSQQKYDSSAAKLLTLKQTLNGLSFDYIDFETTVLELELYDQNYRQHQSQYLGELEAQREVLVAKLDAKSSVDKIDVPTLQLNARMEIDQIIAKIEAENEVLQQVSINEKVLPLENEVRELINEKKIHDFKPKIAREIFRQKKHNLVKSGVSNCATRSVTLFSNQLTARYITQNLQDAFKAELSKFGFKNILVDTGTKGIRGKQHHYLKLSEPHAGNVSLKDILSEGEHRCIALSTFLSELTLSDHKSTIVFDDPVSSLDHKWRNKIAKRIVEESAIRQVIVFTHDIAFLLMLEEHCSELGLTIDVKGLTRKPKETGIIAANPPWDTLPVSKRVGLLNAACQTLDKTERTQTEEEYKLQAQHAYGKLREAWERCIEEVVLNGAIQRFGRTVQTQRLSKIVDLTETDYKVIDDNMSKCSTYFLGHDTAGALIESIPDAAEVQADVLLLEKFIADMRKRRTGK
ncbi:AAA family ATPase [Pedobacter sp. GR22-6]|uniref:AAA family ATPase n=1 Tax=Pedobacter sp. GR22-6 TaxID=3127957 RepID=UPI00307F6841